MATMGRPQQVGSNPFGNISKHQGSMKSNSSETTGDTLNRISGYRKKSEFVDAASHNKIGKDGFLKLLSHQLQNQDPMKPMDQKQFAADLAQFSQLEQLTNMNKALQNQNNNAPTESKFYGASFLGKQAITSGTSLQYNGKSSVDVPFYLPKNASKAILRITDQQGQMVKQMDLENLSKGSQNISWNGLAADNVQAMKGSYNVQVLAWDQNMMPFSGETKSTGTVTGVRFENGETILSLDGKKSVFLRDVESFKLLGDNKVNNPVKPTKTTAMNAYQNAQKVH